MRASRLFAPTLRESPAAADAPSHRLLLRAAFIRPLAAGLYAYLPLGTRSLAKVASIVREEMHGAGAQETSFPALLPSEPWIATGRWDAYGDLMFRLTDRAGRELCLGPTHEEAFTPVVGSERPSHRDLPVTLYQIGPKYRDEARPRSGLLRAREFLMKDAYSFDPDLETSRNSYRAMVEAYHRVFARCGLDYRVVEADPGLIGGDVNHEFMAPAEVGEDRFASCSVCDYAANLEAATAAVPEPWRGEMQALHELHTPGRPGIAAVVELLGIRPDEMLKTMGYEVDGHPAVVLVPGDREVDEGKLGRSLGGRAVRRLGEPDLDRFGLVKGYVGPQGLEDVTVLADHRVRGGGNWVTGANRADHHVAGVNTGRDFEVDRWIDAVAVRDGDPCPRCRASLQVRRAIEVGHCFQLGTRYSEPLDATFVDEHGARVPFVMGCYGIGISRTLAAIAEQRHDDAGLCWPRSAAPFEVAVVALNMDVPEVSRAAEGLYAELLGAGLDAVLDDRRASAGEKLTDADLVGYPLQVVVGTRGVRNGYVELKARATGARERVAPHDAAHAARASLGRLD